MGRHPCVHHIQDKKKKNVELGFVSLVHGALSRFFSAIFSSFYIPFSTGLIFNEGIFNPLSSFSLSFSFGAKLHPHSLHNFIARFFLSLSLQYFVGKLEKV